MNLNVLEYLGVSMIILTICFIVISIYYMIKYALGNWKMHHQNKCPFCGAYLHGYQYKHKGAKFDAKYCSRCGRSLNSTENTSDSIEIVQEFKKYILSPNEYRQKISKLGCESCRYFPKQCDAVTSNLAPEIFEVDCKNRSEEMPNG